MTKFTIITEHGRRYIVHDNGDIQRTDMPFIPSGNWKFLGIDHVKRNEFISFEKITIELVNNMKFLYKNGKPQYRVRDLDHGTTRSWGDKLVCIQF